MNEFLERVFPEDQCLPSEVLAAFGQALARRGSNIDLYRLIKVNDYSLGEAERPHCHVQEFFQFTERPHPPLLRLIRGAEDAIIYFNATQLSDDDVRTSDHADGMIQPK